jgi:hypothetical protein
MVQINETNVREYIGKSIRAEKHSEVIEGIVRGRSNAVTVDENKNVVHPIEIQTGEDVMAVVLDDGWNITIN